MKQTKKHGTSAPVGPVTSQVKSQLGTMIHIKGEDTFQFGCSCGGRVFHIFRLPVARKRKVKTAHRVRIIVRCVDCHKIVRIAFGGIRARG
jgi:hypothetical protein